jgi:ferric-dicitrate binding protein FerR (iron transport regulator)
MNSTSSPNAEHPDSTQLDQLRAGLLDHQPEARSRMLEHLRDCASCRQHAATIDRLVATQRHLPDPRLAHQLRARRLAALAGAAPRQPATRRLAPAFALAAVVAVVIGVGAFLELNSPRAPQELAQTSNDNVPDLYADIDFYLWLSNHPPTENADADRS